jgi:hypothetical protein
MMAATNPSGLEFNKNEKKHYKILERSLQLRTWVESLKANDQRF